MITRYVHHDPQAVESPGAGFPTYEELVAENARLRGALEPFAILPNGQNSDETYCVAISFRAGEYRRARAALNGEKP